MPNEQCFLNVSIESFDISVISFQKLQYYPWSISLFQLAVILIDWSTYSSFGLTKDELSQMCNTYNWLLFIALHICRWKCFTWRICSRDMKQKQEFRNVIGYSEKNSRKKSRRCFFFLILLAANLYEIQHFSISVAASTWCNNITRILILSTWEIDLSYKFTNSAVHFGNDGLRIEIKRTHVLGPWFNRLLSLYCFNLCFGVKKPLHYDYYLFIWTINFWYCL